MRVVSQNTPGGLEHIRRKTTMKQHQANPKSNNGASRKLQPKHKKRRNIWERIGRERWCGRLSTYPILVLNAWGSSRPILKRHPLADCGCGSPFGFNKFVHFPGRSQPAQQVLASFACHLHLSVPNKTKGRKREKRECVCLCLCM